MKLKFSISACIVLITILLGGCSKTVDPVWMIHYEEGCRPLWSSEKDSKTKKNLESLLRSDGIIPLKIKIKGERSDQCKDCSCLTGKTYHVQVDRDQMSYLYYYGFQAE